jgi:D-amino-acid dehydrogenase
MSDRVVVIGGGVIGAMSAWYLVQAGRQVTIVDRDRFGAACSHGNCGYVSPSHILPLTRPGQVSASLREMLKRNSTFAIKPRWSLDSLQWFWKFGRRCNQRDMLAAAAGRHQLLQSSKRLYQELISGQGIDCEWKEAGILFVFDTPQGFQRYAATDRLLREEFGVGATPYDGQQLIELEPALKPGLGGAWHYECDCHLRPDKLMDAMRDLLTRHGVTFLEQTSVDSFVRENGRARAILCGERPVEADQFVVTTGAWTPFLNRHLGFRVPIEPGKGYSLTMPRPARMPRIPIIFEDAHVAITPMETKYRIGSTMEFVGYDTSIRPQRLQLLKTAASKYLHDPYCEPVEEEWYGWRPMTWDGKPVIDRSPAMSNVWVAAGHNMLGISLATGTGQLVRELMLGETPHVDPGHFSVARLG